MGDQTSTHRILVVANKSWEADPLVSVCLNPKLRPTSLLNWSPGAAGIFSTPGNGARPSGVAPAPRCICTSGSSTIEVWCIEDWMGNSNHSSSKVKIQEALPTIFGAGKQPDFVVAFGTANFPDSDTANGCAVIGSNAYLFNPYREPPPGLVHDPKDDWDDPDAVGHLMTSKEGAGVIAQFSINPDLRLPIDGRFVPAPTKPATPPVLLPATNYVALSEVNIANYDDYAWSDRFAFEKFKGSNPAASVGSIETTHGLIRLVAGDAFIFVSGITDRLGYFNQDLGPRTAAQNFLAAHNAGIAAVWTLPLILNAIGN